MTHPADKKTKATLKKLRKKSSFDEEMKKSSKERKPKDRFEKAAEILKKSESDSEELTDEKAFYELPTTCLDDTRTKLNEKYKKLLIEKELMTDTSLDPELDIPIDRDALDYEWERHGSITHKYGKEEVNANSLLRIAQRALKRVKAEIDIELRENWKDYSSAKITENAILNKIRLDEEVMYLEDKILDYQDQVDTFKKLNGSLFDKKESLREMVRLYFVGYWGDLKIPIDEQERYLEQGREQMRKEMKKDLKDRLIKKTRQ